MDLKLYAFHLAERRHGSQKYGELPYIYHLKKTAQVAEELMLQEEIVIACILHDILEDTSTTYQEIKADFGFEIAEMVYAVTDELGRNRRERKEKTYPKIAANWKATMVKVCDRIANIEHCIQEGNTDLLDMYAKEHESFYMALKVKGIGAGTIGAWERLNNLIAPHLPIKFHVAH